MGVDGRAGGLADANGGLSILQDLLQDVKRKHPDMSYGDLWTMAGAEAGGTRHAAVTE